MQSVHPDINKLASVLELGKPFKNSSGGGSAESLGDAALQADRNGSRVDVNVNVKPAPDTAHPAPV